MSREEKLTELKDSLVDAVDTRIEKWENQSTTLRTILEGRTGEGEIRNYLVNLSLPYLNESINSILGGTSE